MKPPHIMTLADLSPRQINHIITHAHSLKIRSQKWLAPHIPIHQQNASSKLRQNMRLPSQSLFSKTIALLFSKRSTRTRIAAETSAELLGGRALFLGREDIQLGVNESARDTAQVISGMCQGIFARVGDHSEIEELAQYSKVPVLNALSSLWHPTQILADLLTLHENAGAFSREALEEEKKNMKRMTPILPELPPLTIAYVGDCANVLNDMLVTYPRLGHKVKVAAPLQYRSPPEVMARVKELGCDQNIEWFEDPKEAVWNANVIVNDTWISMGQEAEKADRLKAFEGYQVTEELCKFASPDWRFMHCLPRKPHEVNDAVFYGPRSLAFPEAENRKWTIMALFDLQFGRWNLDPPKPETAFIEDEVVSEVEGEEAKPKEE
ncbi:Ornithine carbamoyltransferase, mitochondrial [Psilocybe cubensis]|uniref:ornithine carbamoyltransferase n=2 Tax=Psilocybe cubensis TaxID=181762 RepID=A0A8H8CFU2_PSICU|nr:Ornithine carbamoyltransferase, mitochondrial [Psilocybe cubensis]KAH9475414.1 Ornithine carbamoyltransferase, mitochondrial [Psilocybe cubensis]